MARYHFGQGAYSNFADPLPSVVAHLRTYLYTHLAPIANHMMERMNRPQRYPATHVAFRKECQQQGQTQPTPLLLCYEEGGFNCLHRDIYGPTLFPLQAMVMLSQPGKDFEGGRISSCRKSAEATCAWNGAQSRTRRSHDISSLRPSCSRQTRYTSCVHAPWGEP